MRLRRATARSPRGQSLVIVAAAFIGLAMFVGLAVDGGILYITQAQLRRAVDSAAVAAATQMRVGQSPAQIEVFAKQFIILNGVDPKTVTVSMWNYNNGEQPPRDNPTDTCRNHPGDKAYDLYGLCTTDAQKWRKYIRIEASSVAKFAFVPIMGIYTSTVVTAAQSEAASLDTVIVIDTSMSMGDRTPNFSGGNETTVAACNAVALTDPKPADRSPGANCAPLWDAKDAAKLFVSNLYPNYDRVAIVNFDFRAHIRTITDPVDSSVNTGFSFYRGTTDSDSAKWEVDDTLGGHDATGIYRALDLVPLDHTAAYPAGYAIGGLGPLWKGYGYFNPLDSRCALTNTTASHDLNVMSDLTPLPACPGHPNGKYTLVDTCTGCGLRVASNLLKLNGRPTALWLIILLSDGVVNVSDVPLIPATVDSDPDPSLDEYNGNVVLKSGLPLYSEFPNGFCGLDLSAALPPGNRALWMNPNCTTGFFTKTVTASPLVTQTFRDSQNWHVRYCGPFHRGGPTTCPPGAQWSGTTTPISPTSPSYGAVDYARDMADQAALSVNCKDPNNSVGCHAQQPGHDSDLYNINEPTTGSPIVIYTIGLGDDVVHPPDYSGEELLRYIASVGDDGDRVTNPCPQSAPGEVNPAKHKTNCSNYYWAPGPSALRGIFQDIAKRIFTRLTK